MVLFPIGATWKMQRLSEGRRLLEGGAYLDEAWHLLEELRYSSINMSKKLSVLSSSVFSLY